MNNLTDKEKLELTDIAAKISSVLIAAVFGFSEGNFEKFKLSMDFALAQIVDAHKYAKNIPMPTETEH